MGTQTLSLRFYIRELHIRFQIVCLFFLYVAVTPFLASHLDEALWQTLGLFYFVAAAGLAIITNLSHDLKDRYLQYLGYVYLLKLALAVVVLFWGWTPMLDVYSLSFGYDPQVYYFRAIQLAENGFTLKGIPAVSYMGIIYYYGLIFSIFGINPVIPMLFNQIVTLLAVCMLIRLGYQVKKERNRSDWLLGLTLVIPDIFWFDLLTSRETVIMALITIALMFIALLFFFNRRRRFTVRSLIPVMLILVLIGIIRTTMLIPIAAVTFMFIILTPRLKWKSRYYLIILFVSLIVYVLVIAPILSEQLGSYQFDYLRHINVINQADWARDQSTWSEKSFGINLVADSVAELIAYTPIKIAAYLIVPFPNVPVTLAGLEDGFWSDWQNMFAALSSLLYVILFPFILASLYDMLKGKREIMVFHIPFWFVWIAGAVGTQMIQIRYRVMAVPFLWGCIWLGRQCQRKIIYRFYLLWILILCTGVGIYAAYKGWL